MWAPKPHLNHTGCGKGKAGKVVGGKIGRKKGRSSKRGNTKVFKFRAMPTHYIFQYFCII